MANAKTTELVISGMDDATINRVASFQEALQTAAQVTGFSQDDLIYQASGYPLLEDKDHLLAVPFIIMEAKFSESKKYKNADGVGNRFVILYVVTEADEKWTVTDGSTGIAAQVEALIAEREEKGIMPSNQAILVKNGLTRSDYEYTDEKGNVSNASTYYLG
jgi:hypothetical protein